MFLSACAKVGLEALIDEATGYQICTSWKMLSRLSYEPLSQKNCELGEKTFPYELWLEFVDTRWQWIAPKPLKWWGKASNRDDLRHARPRRG